MTFTYIYNGGSLSDSILSEGLAKSEVVVNKNRSALRTDLGEAWVGMSMSGEQQRFRINVNRELTAEECEQHNLEPTLGLAS